MNINGNFSQNKSLFSKIILKIKVSISERVGSIGNMCVQSDKEKIRNVGFRKIWEHS